MSSYYTLTTVPGYTTLVPCAQSALAYALDPRFASYGNCQSQVGAAGYASCLCLTAYKDVTSILDSYHQACPAITVWDVDAVFNQFCSGEVQQLTPVTSSSASTTPRSASTTSQIASTTVTSSGSMPSAGSTRTSENLQPTSLTDTSGSSATATPTSTPSSTPRPHLSLSVAVIAAIAAVGLIFFVVLGSCCFCWILRKRRRANSQLEEDRRSHTSYDNYNHQSTVNGSHLGSNMLERPVQIFPRVPARSGGSSQSSGLRPWHFSQPSSNHSNVRESNCTVAPNDSVSEIGALYPPWTR